MKRILIANDLLQGGGVEKLMHDFVLNWKEEYDITILTEYYDKEFSLLYPKNIKYFHYHPKNALGNIRGLRRLNQFLKQLYRTIVFINIKIKTYDIAVAMKEGIISKYISNSNAKMKLGWVHVDYFNAYWTKMVYKSQEKELICMKSFHHIICVSEAIKNSIIHVIGDPGNLIVRYNPIDVNMVLELSLNELDQNNVALPIDKPLFITIGRLHEQKGYDLLLQACYQLERDGLDYQLWMIGSGKDENKLKAILNKLKLKNVKFLGEKKNPYTYLKYASWFISSSRYEGYSLVTQEAAVLGIPIIATDCSGIRELLGMNSEYGIIVDISVDSLYLAMKNAIENPDIHKIYQGLIKKRARIINYEDRMKSITNLFDNKL